MVTADTLSCLSPLDEFEVPDMNVKIHHLIRITPAKMEDFNQEVRNWLKARQDNQCYNYDRYTKELPELHGNQAIYVQDPERKPWNPGRVVDQGDTPRSYIIETETGTQLRRNKIHLRPNNTSNNLANNLSSCIPQ